MATVKICGLPVSHEGMSMVRLIPAQSTPARIRIALEWMSGEMTAAMESALPHFDADERAAIVAVSATYKVGEWSKHQSMAVVKAVVDFFQRGDGAMWEWPLEKVETLGRKLMVLPSMGTLAILAWGQRFWQSGERKSIKQYCIQPMPTPAELLAEAEAALGQDAS